MWHYIALTLFSCFKKTTNLILCFQVWTVFLELDSLSCVFLFWQYLYSIWNRKEHYHEPCIEFHLLILFAIMVSRYLCWMRNVSILDSSGSLFREKVFINWVSFPGVKACGFSVWAIVLSADTGNVSVAESWAASKHVCSQQALFL